ncbi:MAG: NUDIX domain-containing protein [Anaerolineales bacterium]|nr:NUDIX domain-containing protein [Anaerolineales bacterium]
MFKLGAFAIIRDGDKVLLCHRRDMDLWNLPGGQVERGESPWDAVIREAQEETGLTVVVERLAGVYFKPEADEIVFSFVCQAVGGALTLNVEADRLDYFPISKLPENMSAKQVERIQDAMANPAALTMKRQTGPSSAEVFRNDS